MKFLFLLITVPVFITVSAQNVGVGTATPTERLEVIGKLKTNGIILTTGGAQYDFLTKATPDGTVGFRKGHGGMGVNYIICTSGIFPSQSGGNLTSGPVIGEIVAFAGNFIPSGWKSCNGQLLKIDTLPNTALYSLIGTTYGGTDSTFALPDLRGIAPVGVGTSPAGYLWNRGQKSY